MAKSILRMLSECWRERLFPRRIEILVTPWTSDSTSLPKSFRSSARLTSVSSSTSCRSAAITPSASIWMSTRIEATFRGWTMYGSPEARFCVPWRFSAQSAAARIRPFSSGGYAESFPEK